jgi:opine dehydrogenase
LRDYRGRREGDWREKVDLTAHRYRVEDTCSGLSLLVSIGRRAVVPTPIAAGFLSIGSAIAGRDLHANGRTLEKVGLADTSRADMAALLQRGG